MVGLSERENGVWGETEGRSCKHRIPLSIGDISFRVKTNNETEESSGEMTSSYRFMDENERLEQKKIEKKVLATGT